MKGDEPIKIMRRAGEYPQFRTEWVAGRPVEGSLRQEGGKWLFDFRPVGGGVISIQLFEFLHCKPMEDEVIQK